MNQRQPRRIQCAMPEEIAYVESLLLKIVKALVDSEDDVEIDQTMDGVDRTVFTVTVAQGEARHVIGKYGHTARSLRTVLGALGARYHHKFALQITETLMTSFLRQKGEAF